MALNVVVTETAPLFDLALAKSHLRVEHSDDDVLIEAYSDAAVSSVMQYCNLDLVPQRSGAVAAFKVAALLALADLYANRGDTDQPLSRAARMLVDPYRWLRV